MIKQWAFGTEILSKVTHSPTTDCKKYAQLNNLVRKVRPTAMTNRRREATAIFKIPGMSRSGRAQKLRRAVGKLDGILVFDINYVLDTVSMKYDANKLTLDQIKKEIG